MFCFILLPSFDYLTTNKSFLHNLNNFTSTLHIWIINYIIYLNKSKTSVWLRVSDFNPHFCHFLSYHGDGDPHSETEGEVLSVRDAPFANRQAVTWGEAWLCHHCLCWRGEMSCMGQVIKHGKGKKEPEILCNVLICFDLCRPMLIMLIVWLLTSRKSECICSWRICQVGCVSCMLTPQTSCLFRFSTELNSGLLEVISPPAAYYPDFTTLKETFGDSKERVK